MDIQYIYGRNPVIEVLKSQREIEKVLVLNGNLKGSINKIIALAKERNIIIQEASKDSLDKLSNKGVHQGVVAITTSFKYSNVKDMLKDASSKSEAPFIIILDGIEDPYNLGSIIRTAHSAGAHGIVIPERRAASVNEVVYSASAGAVEHIKVAKVTNINQEIKRLKEEGLWIYGADMSGEEYFETDLRGPLALVIGSEGKGISRLVKENCDFLINIPMKGKVSSLNASNAASILIYDVVRQSYG